MIFSPTLHNLQIYSVVATKVSGELTRASLGVIIKQVLSTASAKEINATIR